MDTPKEITVEPGYEIQSIHFTDTTSLITANNNKVYYAEKGGYRKIKTLTGVPTN